jgi:hypothetical protein
MLKSKNKKTATCSIHDVGEPHKEVGRRQFLKQLAVTLGGVAMLGNDRMELLGAGADIMETKYPIIDCHTHIRRITDFDGFTKIMNDTGLSAINLLALVNPTPPWWAKQGTPEWNQRDKTIDYSVNLASMLFKALHQDKAYVFGNLDHNTSEVLAGKHDYARQAQILIDMGVDGFKMWEGGTSLRIQTGLPLNSPVYDEYYSILEDQSLPILYHVNGPYMDEIDRMLPKHPNLKIIFAHFYGGSRDLPRLGLFFDTWPNVYVDLTPGMIFRGLAERRDEAREFFIKYQDRILFGTDATAGSKGDVEWSKGLVGLIRRFLERKDNLALAEVGMGNLEEGHEDEPEGDQRYYHELNASKGLYLGDDVLKKIYAENFVRIAGAKSRTVNPEVALSECGILLERLSEQPEDETSTDQQRQRMADHFKEVERIEIAFRNML